LNASCAEYADVEALELFANDVDVITYEFENVPSAAAMILSARRPVLPDREILETTQDRLAEKDFVTRLGIGTADYADVSSAASLREAIARIGLPAVIKTRRFGYDGKGQALIREGDDPDQIWSELCTRSAILEAFIPFEREISVIAARSADGHVECYDVTENEHRDHILKISRAPAAIPERPRRPSTRHRREDRDRPRLCRRARGRNVRAGRPRRVTGHVKGAGQRDRAAGAQFRPLDARRRVDLPIRAAISGPLQAGRSADRSVTGRSP